MDISNKTELVVKYTPLVKRISLQFKRKLPSSISLDDIISSGMFGLWKAILKEDIKNREENFEWYTISCIKNSIIENLRTEDWLPRRLRKRLNVESNSTSDSDKKTQPVSILKFDDLSHGYEKYFSWDESLDDLYFEKEIAVKLHKAIDKLPERKKFLIHQSYFEDVTLEKIGTFLGVKKPRVCRLRLQALEAIKSDMLANNAF